MIKNNTVLTDNDFINHLVESKLSDDELIEKISIILSELGFSAVVHPLVYEKEIMSENPRVKLFFEESIFKKIDFSDIFGNNTSKKEYYILLIRELFKTLKNKMDLPTSNDELLKFWVRKSSLGEIHSIATCVLCNYGVFLSDDDDSKKLKKIVKQKFATNIKIYNRKELIDKHESEGKTTINRNTRRSLAHQR